MVAAVGVEVVRCCVASGRRRLADLGLVEVAAHGIAEGVSSLGSRRSFRGRRLMGRPCPPELPGQLPSLQASPGRRGDLYMPHMHNPPRPARRGRSPAGGATYSCPTCITRPAPRCGRSPGRRGGLFMPHMHNPPSPHAAGVGAQAGPTSRRALLGRRGGLFMPHMHNPPSPPSPQASPGRRGGFCLPLRGQPPGALGAAVRARHGGCPQDSSRVLDDERHACRLAPVVSGSIGLA